MNPLRIRGTGYGRFDSFDVEIPLGTTAVIGPNGAGKSRLLNAIELALFANGTRDLAQWLAPGADRMELVLELEHASETYRVRRTYQGGTRSRCTLDLERLDVGELDLSYWTPLTRESATDTQTELERILGLTRDTFNASAFVAQGNSGYFAEAAASERKALLGQILDPSGLWENACTHVKTLARANEQELIRAAGAIGEREERLAAKADIDLDISRLVIAQTEAQTALEDAEKRTLAAQQAVLENAAGVERIQSLTAAKDRAYADAERARRDAQAAHDAELLRVTSAVRIPDLEQRAAAVPELERLVEEQQAARAAVASKTAEKEHAQALASSARSEEQRLARDLEGYMRQRNEKADQARHLEQAHDGAERCPTCEQTLGAEARVATLRTLAATIADLDGVIGNADSHRRAAAVNAQLAGQKADAIEIPAAPVGDYTAGLASARAAVSELATACAVVEQNAAAAARAPELAVALDRAVEVYEAAARELDAAAQTAPDAAQLQQAVTDARAAVTTARATLDRVTHDLIRARQQAEQLDQAKLELVSLRRTQATGQAAADVHLDALAMFGRDGIPVLLVENAIPQIELEANRILELMPTEKGETMRVELVTQAEQKSVDHLKETLDILVTDALSTRQYQTFSGGEKERLDLALRIGLARLLAHRRGAESRVLVIDEPDGLDQAGQQQLVDVIASVAGDYDRILLASHAPRLRDAFDQVVEVGSDERGMSFLVGAPAREAVAA